MDEVQLIRSAFLRAPSPMLRVRLAKLLLNADLFDDCIALLFGNEDLGFFEELMLTEALLARESLADSARASEAAGRALGFASTPQERAAALAAQGKALLRLGDAAAQAALEAALSADPRNMNACKRLAALHIEAGNPDAALTAIDELARRGAAHARLFAARTLAYARRGDIAAARAAAAFADLYRAGQIDTPPGWDTLEAFNTALAEQLLAHPHMRFERYGSASHLTSRIDAPVTDSAPLVRVLMDQISAAIARQIEDVSAVDHPWNAARPAEASLRSWCVITDGDGFETWHVHQFGWLSGVYYVRVPDSITQGSSEAGCLAFGLPDDLVGEAAAAAYGEHLVRPQEGLMLAFPSHTYHRTFPHGAREKRICIAFDLRPN